MSSSFVKKLRDPDESFLLQLTRLASIVPLAFGFFFLIVGLVIMLVGRQAEAGSVLAHLLTLLSRPLSYLALILILGSSIALRLLKTYVKVKLKKNEGVRL